MYSLIAEKLIYPLGDLTLGTSLIKYYHQLQETQWWPPEQLRELQNAKLRALMTHAYHNVPYYRRVLEERGLTDQDVRTVDDLPRLPILTKDDIRQNFADMLAKDFKKWKPILNYTGGSTGEPLKYYITKDVASIGWAGMFRAWNWAGYRIGDKRIAFGGSSLVPNRAAKLSETIRDKLERNLRISAVSMNASKYSQTVGIIRKYESKFIYGYPSALYLLADYCKSNNINDIKLKAAFSTAEVLLPNYRAAIENQFQCEVFDQYGSYDGGGQALECENHQGLHVSMEKVILEVLDNDGRKITSEKPGHIIVTDLHNYAMPFIRYAVGDIGTPADNMCPCGRGLPILKAIEGRTSDIIRLYNGTILAGPALTLVFKDRNVRQFQLIQVAEDELLVKIVKGAGYTEQDSQYIVNVLRHHAGKDVKVELEFCNLIQPEKNNKYRFIISLTN
jgi:phenylacetate-CoA ligase